jgi:Coenzyme PQQ synthesis protein D (PqqD)
MEGRTQSPDARFQLAAGIVSEASGDRQVVLSADGSTMHTLNPVGSAIVRLLPRRRAEILAELELLYADVGRDRLAGDLDGFIDELTEAGLIVRSDADG